MSMHPHSIPAIPEEIAYVAHAILPEGNVWMRMREEVGTLYQDEDFQDLFPSRGQPAETPWRLALVTLMQYGEGLTDRQAADAVCTRIDWKYVLSLELTDPGFDFSVLSEFRGRLLAHGAERRLFDQVLNLCRERGWLKARGKQRTGSRLFTRHECHLDLYRWMGSYPNSIKRAFREKVKETAGRGRAWLRLWPNLCIATVIKRAEKRHVVEVTRKMTLGTLEQARQFVQMRSP